MFLSPKLARFTASFLLAVFLAVLAATMAKSAQREGITAIWSGAADASVPRAPHPSPCSESTRRLLAGVVFLRPRRGDRSTPPVAGGRFGRRGLRDLLRPAHAGHQARADAHAGAGPAVESHPGGRRSLRVGRGIVGEIPDRLEPFYFTEFSEWIGRPLSSQPIARLLSRPLPDWIDEDRFHLVFYRSDCDKCHELLDAFFSGPLETPVLAVEIPDGDPAAALGMPCDECLLHRLPEGTEYVLTTPVLLTVENGIVLAACEDSDDHALVSATIAATP